MTPVGRLRLWATGTIVGAAVLWVGSCFGIGKNLWAAGGTVAVGLVAPSYWALSMTLRRSNAAFFGAFLGGLFGRLAGVGGAVAWAWHADRSSAAPVALSTVGALAGLTVVELIFLGRQSRLPT